MKKSLLYATLLCAGFYAASCSDNEGGKEPDPAPEYFRVAFDGPALAAELNTDFTAFCRKYAEYVSDPAANAPFSAHPSSAARA